MKPSGPGLLFDGRFLITVSISVLVMGLLPQTASTLATAAGDLREGKDASPSPTWPPVGKTGLRGWELSGLAVCSHQTIWVILFVFIDGLKGERKEKTRLWVA